jgi:hypothetical protein
MGRPQLDFGMASHDCGQVPPQGADHTPRFLARHHKSTSLMALILVPILVHDRNFPKSAAEGILGAIALGVFLLSKYLEHRKKSK